MECPKIEISSQNEFIGCNGVKVSDEIIMQWMRKAKEEERYEDLTRYSIELQRRRNEWFVLELFGGGNDTLGGTWSIVAASHDFNKECGFTSFDKAKKYVLDEMKSSKCQINYLIVSWSELEYQETEVPACREPGKVQIRCGYVLKPSAFQLNPY